LTTRKELAAKRQQQRKTNRILFIVGGVLILAAAAFALWGKSPAPAADGPAQVGQKLKDFSLIDISGNTVRLSDYAGKVVLINAWATWCPPCTAEMPDLNAYYQAHQEDNFVILAINAGDPASAAAAFAEEKGLAFPVLLDSNVQVLNSLGVHSYPTSILVGADGVVKSIHLGMYSMQGLETEVTPYLP